MRRFILIFTILSLGSLTAEAKLIMIDIKKALQEAIIIKPIIIIAYTDSTMLYKYEDSKDTLSINCKIKKTSESFRQMLIARKMMNESDMAGKWPSIGQSVLIVINIRRTVALFAIKVADNYRFWDPNSIPFANSMFSIPKENPFHPLPGCDNPFQTSEKGNYWICTDGCLVSCAAVKQHGQLKFWDRITNRQSK